MTTRLNPYLSFRDNAREAMDFYHSVFGGELTRSTFGEYHASEDPAEQDKIMHSMLVTDGGLALMAADTPNAMDNTPGTNFSVSLSGEDEAELRGYWEKLSKGGTVDRAAREGAVGRQLRHVRRQVRDQLDGQHRRQSLVGAVRPRMAGAVTCRRGPTGAEPKRSRPRRRDRNRAAS